MCKLPVLKDCTLKTFENIGELCKTMGSLPQLLASNHTSRNLHISNVDPGQMSRSMPHEQSGYLEPNSILISFLTVDPKLHDLHNLTLTWYSVINLWN